MIRIRTNCIVLFYIYFDLFFCVCADQLNPSDSDFDEMAAWLDNKVSVCAIEFSGIFPCSSVSLFVYARQYVGFGVNLLTPISAAGQREGRPRGESDQHGVRSIPCGTRGGRRHSAHHHQPGGCDRCDGGVGDTGGTVAARQSKEEGGGELDGAVRRCRRDAARMPRLKRQTLERPAKVAVFAC